MTMIGPYAPQTLSDLGDGVYVDSTPLNVTAADHRVIDSYPKLLLFKLGLYGILSYQSEYPEGLHGE